VTYPSGKIQRFFRKDLIVMGDLPRWKNTKIFQKESHCNEWSIQVKKIRRKGLIIMSDLPKWENIKIFQKGSHCNGWPIQVEKYEDFLEGVSL